MSRVVRTLFVRTLTLAAMAAAPVLILPSAAQAQDAQVASASPKMTLDDMIAQWASLERPLLGVTDLTDLQRDAIELLEARYRKEFDEEAQPIRNARVTMLQRGPFERQAIERSLQRLAELRKKQLQQLRGLLTEAQRVPYDANLRKIAEEEAAAETKREREAAFYTP